MLTTSSSAVLRELTIQSWSRYWLKTSTAVPCSRPGADGVPRLHGVWPSGWYSSPRPNLAGARL